MVSVRADGADIDTKGCEVGFESAGEEDDGVFVCGEDSVEVKDVIRLIREFLVNSGEQGVEGEKRRTRQGCCDRSHLHNQRVPS